MKWYTWVIIILGLLTVGSGMATGYSIIQGQKNVLKEQLNNINTVNLLSDYTVYNGQLDDILKKIEAENNFKNYSKIKIYIDDWKLIKTIEKEKNYAMKK
jgi:hypothetical protein